MYLYNKSNMSIFKKSLKPKEANADANLENATSLKVNWNKFMSFV